MAAEDCKDLDGIWQAICEEEMDPGFILRDNLKKCIKNGADKAKVKEHSYKAAFNDNDRCYFEANQIDSPSKALEILKNRCAQKSSELKGAIKDVLHDIRISNPSALNLEEKTLKQIKEYLECSYPSFDFAKCLKHYDQDTCNKKSLNCIAESIEQSLQECYEYSYTYG